MSSDIEFLRKRLTLVEQEIALPSAYQYQGQDKGRPRRTYHTRQNTTYRREARLLRKLLTRAHPGNVLSVLIAWRHELGQFAVDHRNEHKEAIRAYDEWRQLPRHARSQVPAPPKPPGLQFTDYDGALWIIDDGFLALLDDLIERLQKWLDEEEKN